MAGEEQNTQQPTGGKGVCFQTKKQNISRGELPKQKGARGIIVHEKVKAMDEVGASVASKKGKRGCPTSGLSEQKREKMQNEDCQRCRKKMKAEFRRFQQKEKKLKTLCEKLGVAEEDLEAEFRRLQQIEIKHNALCDKFGVAQEALEMPIDNFMELDDLPNDDFMELDDLPIDDFMELDDLPIDDFMELDDLPIDDQYKNKSLRLQNIEEGTVNEEVNQNAMPIDDDFIELDDLTMTFGSMFDDQSSTTGGEGAVINKSPHQYEVQLEDYNDQIEFSSSKHYSLTKLENKIIKLNKDHSN